MTAIFSRLLHNSTAMTLVGIVIGSFITGIVLFLNNWISFQREQGTRRMRERRDALREINKGLEHYQMSIMALWPSALEAFIQNKIPKLSPIPGDGASLFDLEFQLALYAPDLQREYRMVLDSTKSFTDSWLESITTSAMNSQDPQKLLAATQTMQKLTEAIDTFRDALVAYSRKHCR